MTALPALDATDPANYRLQGELPLVLRRATSDDLPRILSDWLKASYEPSMWGKSIPWEVHAKGHRQVIFRILDRRGFEDMATVACSQEDPKQLFGWTCTEPPDIVHYVYVKHVYRRLGVAAALLRGALPQTPKPRPLRCSHTGRAFDAISRRYPLTYDPYLGFL